MTRLRGSFVRCVTASLAIAAGVAGLASADPVIDPRATPMPEPSPAFGRVLYRASKVGSFESLGVIVIQCRNKDDVPRRVEIDIFDVYGRRVSTFGPRKVDALPPGAKITFVGDGRYYKNRPDVRDMRVAHLTRGTARVVSDAVKLRCLGRMRFDPGYGYPGKLSEMGFARNGREAPPPTW